MAEIEQLTEESLPAAFAGTPGPLIVDFWAEWCGPCRVMAPMLERLAREYPEVRVAKVNVDEEPWLALRYEIAAIPTLIRFDGGEEAVRVPGALPYERLLVALGVSGTVGSAAA
ncbi:MAG: thioredoxin family protein [Solirubrobacterales bacterium]